jgi:hypothetical protein
MALTRRELLAGAGALSTLALSGPLRTAVVAPRKLFSQAAIVAPLTRAAEVRAAGGDHIIEAIGRVLVPDKPDAEFSPWRDRVLAAEQLAIRGRAADASTQA